MNKCISSILRKIAEEVKDLPELIFTVGISGSGKSTWINSQKGYEIVSLDEIRKSMGNVSDQTKNVNVIEQAVSKIKNLLSQGKNIIYDATNVVSLYRTNFLNSLPPHKRKAKIFEVSPDEAKRRIKKDVAEGKDRSNVPDEVVDRMYENYLKTINENQLEAEGFEII